MMAFIVAFLMIIKNNYCCFHYNNPEILHSIFYANQLILNNIKFCLNFWDEPTFLQKSSLFRIELLFTEKHFCWVFILIV